MQTNPLALFGDHLARLRKSRGWSQEKLALESGLARSYVSGIERGRRNVALVNICVLADTLGVPTSEMLRFTTTPPGAEDATPAAERTPLPQISRSLCRLESRDQVWLAEVIRSLSSRLSHCAPPQDDAAALAAPPASPAAPDEDDSHDNNSPDNDNHGSADGEDAKVCARTDAAAGAHPPLAADPSPEASDPPPQDTVDTGFEAGLPMRRAYASAGSEGYRDCDLQEAVVRMSHPQRDAPHATRVSRAQDIPVHPSMPRHDNSQRPPTGDEN